MGIICLFGTISFMEKQKAEKPFVVLPLFGEFRKSLK
jgi:hypothetical protein